MTLKSVITEGDAAAAAVLAEAEEWQKIMSQDAERELDVYLDIKSPHAYLAVRPSLEVARDYEVRVNFLPYTLSYVAIGVTTSLESDKKRRPADPAADRKARMYYAAAGSTPSCRVSLSEAHTGSSTLPRRTRRSSSPNIRRWRCHS